MRLRLPTSALVVALLAALSLASGAGAQSHTGSAPPAPQRFAYSRDASIVVVRFAEIVSAIEDPDPGPSLRVYGDGRVQVHYPRYMLRAGDYTLQLAPAELNQLVGSLISRGLAEFDAPDVRRRKRNLEARSDLFFESFDAVTTEIELRLERYQPRDGAAPDRRVHKRVTWPALRADAKRHPQIAEIQDLAAAQRELLSLMHRPDLVKVD
jgi:hypothetical protein